MLSKKQHKCIKYVRKLRVFVLTQLNLHFEVPFYILYTFDVIIGAVLIINGFQ